MYVFYINHLKSRGLTIQNGVDIVMKLKSTIVNHNGVDIVMKLTQKYRLVIGVVINKFPQVELFLSDFYFSIQKRFTNLNFAISLASPYIKKY